MRSQKELYRLKVKALTDYWSFIELIQFKGGQKAFGEIHERLSIFVSDKTKKRKLVLMPRGHFKSTVCSVGFVLWRIYQNPDIRVLVGTATGDLAKSFVREIKQYLEDEALQEEVWNARPHISGRLVPIMDRAGSTRRNRKRDEDLDEAGTDTEAADKKVIWRGDAIQVLRRKIMKEPTVCAASVGSPATGFHYDLAIFDDLVTFDNADTESKRERILNWVGDCESVIDPFNAETELGDEIITIGTRYFKGDLYGLLLGEDIDEDSDEADEWIDPDLSIWSMNIFVNGVDNSEGYIFPERFNEEVFERTKRRLLKQPNGLRRWASQYLNSIMTNEEQILKPESIQYMHPNTVKVMDGLVEIRLQDAAPIIVRPYLVIDPAISEKKTADNTVIGVGGTDADHNLYLFDMKVGKFKPDDTVKLAYELLDKWKLRSLHVDSEKLGLSLIHTFRSKFKDYRPIVLNEYKAQGEKKARIATFLEPLFANHKVYMMTWMAGLKQLMEEIAFFPRDGVHDDTVDCLAMIAHVAMPTRNQKKRQTHTPRKRVNVRYGGTR